MPPRGRKSKQQAPVASQDPQSDEDTKDTKSKNDSNSQGIDKKSKTIKKSQKKQLDPKQDTKPDTNDQNDNQEVKKQSKRGRKKKDDDSDQKDTKDNKDDKDSKNKKDNKDQLDQKVDNKNDSKKDDEEEKKDDKPEKKQKKPSSNKPQVDKYCLTSNVEVYCDSEKNYSCTLNQANVDHNNNKFYIIQILVDSASGKYYLFTRWGRVGDKGQQACKPCSDLENAKKEYENKYKDKAIKGDYRVLQLQGEVDEEEEEEINKKLKELEQKKINDAKNSKLHERVKHLIDLIYDTKMMNKMMEDAGYDVKKMPLGKLSKENIKKGYDILNQLSDAITKSHFDLISNLSNDFFSYIPHDVGRQQMSKFKLDSHAKIKEKLELLDCISEIQVAMDILSNANVDMNVIDQNYDKLKCKIDVLDKNSNEYKIISQYLINTHADTHKNYTLDLLEVFALEKDGEDAKYTKNIDNKMLLWHGSRLTNFVGILSQGLRIAPPEAPVTGYMFGKGVYFADMISKSANYCFTSKSNNIGLLLLCEVALGQCNELLYADYYANNLPQGKQSTKGCGKQAPPKSSYIDLNGVQVPIGQQQNTSINGSLIYNEYIVYNTDQIKMKYLLKVKFNHKY